MFKTTTFVGLDGETYLLWFAQEFGYWIVDQGAGTIVEYTNEWDNYFS